MPDLRHQLQSLFAPQHRHTNFGTTIVRIVIEGFRCHTNTVVDVGSPVTALCGLNGTGKSTILQLLACAFRDPTNGPWNIKDFFSINAIDSTPFTRHARVQFRLSSQYENQTRSLTISRSTESSRWRGYSRRSRKHVFLAGVGCYTPLNEQPSYVYRSRSFQIAGTSPVSARTKEWVETILGGSYDCVDDHQLSASMRRGNHIASVARGAVRYAEPNMGFGEARTIHIVKTLEALPARSLIILEEPETSLFPSAQYQFGRFLLDVSIEHRHQIFVSTHSEYLLSALPDASRLFLKRTADGVVVIPGLSAAQANSLMTRGNRVALTVLVEDNVAQAIVREIVRDVDGDLLGALNIAIGGDKDVLRKSMTGLRSAGLNVAAVADGDVQAFPRDSFFKLPGTLPPEKEIFCSPEFTAWLAQRYRTHLADFCTQIRGVDHHDWFSRLATHVRTAEDALVTESARAYVNGLTLTDKSSLVDALRSAIRA